MHFGNKDKPHGKTGPEIWNSLEIWAHSCSPKDGEVRVRPEMQSNNRFADHLVDILVKRGFTHCFFLAGGNSMHLLEASRSVFQCIPFVHEVSAVIAAENFNLSSSHKAWVLVTAGPGVTNTITGMAGAWLESHGVVIVGAQVKSTDIGVDSGFRQLGIQEIDGVAAARPFCKESMRLSSETSCSQVADLVDLSTDGRPGPVFLEVPIDLSASPWGCSTESHTARLDKNSSLSSGQLDAFSDDVIRALESATRPLVLIGQGCSREGAYRLAADLLEKRIPIATSWSGADRVGTDFENYVGRPNFFGMRSSNLIVQKCDLLVTIGARLGLQQTGFNVEAFAPNAEIISVDIDVKEMSRSPFRTISIEVDTTEFLEAFLPKLAVADLNKSGDWMPHCMTLRDSFPNDLYGTDAVANGINPYAFMEAASELCDERELLVSCSSGGTFTAFMQAFRNRSGQQIFSNKGLASMGYGLASAIGVALANPGRRVLLFEGDGGFAQNMQELGTVIQQRLPITTFLFDNGGYASIKSSQRRFFGGDHIGCDSVTGLGMPDWSLLARAYGLAYVSLPKLGWRPILEAALESVEPALVRIPVDPEFEYAPKILSEMTPDGAIISNPLHVMHPEISDPELRKLAGAYIDG